MFIGPFKVNEGDQGAKEGEEQAGGRGQPAQGTAQDVGGAGKLILNEVDYISKKSRDIYCAKYYGRGGGMVAGGKK